MNVHCLALLFLCPAVVGQSVWTERARVHGRFHHAMAYDAARDRVVVFGGLSRLGFLGDTWEWDGMACARLAPVSSPGPRSGAALGYDPAGQRCLLFGGADADLRDDTWAWDGRAWTRLPTAVAPSPRRYHGIAYDPVRVEMVLFGGQTGVSDLSDEKRSSIPPTNTVGFGPGAVRRRQSTPSPARDEPGPAPGARPRTPARVGLARGSGVTRPASRTRPRGSRTTRTG